MILTQVKCYLKEHLSKGRSKVSTENSLVPSSHPSAHASSSCGHREQSRALGTLGQVWKGQMQSQLCHTASSVEQLCHPTCGAKPAVLPSVQCTTSCASWCVVQSQLCCPMSRSEPAVLPSPGPAVPLGARCRAISATCQHLHTQSTSTVASLWARG